MRVYYIVHYRADGYAAYGSVTARTDATGDEPTVSGAIAHTFEDIPNSANACPSFANVVYLH